MSIKVIIFYPHLKALVNDQEFVEVAGDSIGQCLEDLVEQYPDIRPKIFDNNGNLMHFINIFHNRQSTHQDPNPLQIHVQDGDEIVISLLIAGG